MSQNQEKLSKEEKARLKELKKQEFVSEPTFLVVNFFSDLVP